MIKPWMRDERIKAWGTRTGSAGHRLHAIESMEPFEVMAWCGMPIDYVWGLDAEDLFRDAPNPAKPCPECRKALKDMA